MKLSIILPIYNVEKYIEECLDAIPVIEGLEVIMVNDGSSDKSKDICEKYIKENWILINQKNMGAREARNTGIEQAKGKHILFLDPDDAFEIGAIEKIIKLLEKNDFVTWETQTMDEQGENTNDYYQGVDYKNTFSIMTTNRFAQWLRTFPREFIIKSKWADYDELILAAFEYQEFSKHEHIKEKLHKYRIRQDSLTRTAKYEGMDENWKEWFELVLTKLTKEETTTWFLHYYKYYSLLFLSKNKEELLYFRKAYFKKTNKKMSNSISKKQTFKFKIFNFLWKTPFYKILFILYK